jgi:MFS family permease
LTTQVTWNGPEDPDNPKNWPTKKKWLAAVLVSFFTLISPISSSMVAPALESIAIEFKITDDVLLELTLSTFVLAYAVGPLFLGPLSEIYGRKIILQLTNLFYIVFNVACGVSKSTGQMISFRFLAGLGGSAPLAVCEEFFVIPDYRLMMTLRSEAAFLGTAFVLKSVERPSPSMALLLFWGLRSGQLLVGLLQKIPRGDGCSMQLLSRPGSFRSLGFSFYQRHTAQ